MPITEVLVPQLGEGLTEVRLLRFLKQPGDPVKRDEHLYEMETDKAIVEVESPYEGTLVEWLAKEGDVLPIGAPVARMETEAAVSAASLPLHAAAPTPSVISPPERPPVPRPEAPAARRGEVLIPPRTRAYCRQLGISEEEMRQIPAPTGKLMPEDVDRYLAERAAGTSASASTAVVEQVEAPYRDIPLSPQQRTFLYRVKRSSQLVVPGTIARPVEWQPIRKVVEALRQRNAEVQPSEFQLFAYCVSRVIPNHPKFRSTLVGEEIMRQYHHLNMGIAVARPNDELVTAVVPNADTLDFPTFIRTLQSRIRRAREGEDQATESIQLLVTYMGAHEITDAVPVLVAPAIAVLFAGATYERDGKLLANLALTFDHRLINGVGAADFLNDIAKQVQAVESLGLE